jgi:hypothetical protein
MEHAVSNEDPPTPATRRWSYLAAATLLVTVIGVVVAIGEWRWPVTRDANGSGATSSPQPGAATVPPPPVPTTARPTGPPAAANGVTLDRLEIQSGGANVRRLPRAIANDPAYAHGLAVACPTNQSDDKARAVVFALRQRYLDLDTAVRPYFPDDPAERARVTALAGVKQRDGSISTQPRGDYTGTTGSPGRITAVVDDAEELTLTVECESADGLAILVGTITTA